MQSYTMSLNQRVSDLLCRPDGADYAGDDGLAMMLAKNLQRMYGCEVIISLYSYGCNPDEPYTCTLVGGRLAYDTPDLTVHRSGETLGMAVVRVAMLCPEMHKLYQD